MPESAEPHIAATPSLLLLYVLRRFLLAAIVGGIAAGTAATFLQVGLWLAFTDAFPEILWRDARLTAALFVGPGVLPPPATADAWAMAVAAMVHFGLSIIYSVVFCIVTCRLAWGSTATVASVGALLGMALYFVNLYGFAQLFPWFAAARDWIALAAHVAFGASATATCRWTLHRGRWEILALGLAQPEALAQAGSRIQR